MNSKLFLVAVVTLTTLSVNADDFEAKRAAILARPRYIIADNDGNDFVYYSTNRPISEKAFIDSRIGVIADTKCETMIYCPWCAGFGHFTVPGIGDTYTNSCPYADTANPIKKFQAIGKDPLQMAIDFCRREKREIFLGLRFNDTHDSGYDLLFPEWKKKHPECLMGTKTNRPLRGGWSAVDFDHVEVREYMKTFWRQFLERYDLDGIEIDFNRHFAMFKNVCNADTIESSGASERQLDVMSVLMKELRDIAEEVGRKKGRPIIVAIRVPDSFELCRCAGVDLERWLKDKSVDLVIVGGYFQINPWRETISKIHALGAKAYVSLDESRIGWVKQWYDFGLIPGREGYLFDVSRMAQAMTEGADGVCFFNHWGSGLKYAGSVDINHTEGYDKFYFAVERGSGGYTPDSYVFNGSRFSKMPRLDPAKPHLMYWFESYEFEVVVGDDLSSPVARERMPTVTAKVLLDTDKAHQAKALTLNVNGRTIKNPTFESNNTTNGLYTFSIPTSEIRRGPNNFSLYMPFVSGKREIRFVDFLLQLKYPKAKKK